MITIKHQRRIHEVKSVSTRLKEMKAREGGRTAKAVLLGTLRGCWRALMRFIAHTSVWATAVALYNAIITTAAVHSKMCTAGKCPTLPQPNSTESDRPGEPATTAWFLGPSFVLPSQFSLYLSYVCPYTLALLLISILLVGSAELVLQVRPCTAAPPPARALTDPKMCASVLKRVKTGVQRYCASGPSPLPPHVGGAEGGMTKQATKRQRSADAAIARHYALSSLACEFVELLSIGLALCIGRAFNALLFTTFRLMLPHQVNWIYPIFCTVFGIALASAVRHKYGACARVVKEAPGQIVGFASALQLATVPALSSGMGVKQRACERVSELQFT